MCTEFNISGHCNHSVNEIIKYKEKDGTIKSGRITRIRIEFKDMDYFYLQYIVNYDVVVNPENVIK